MIFLARGAVSELIVPLRVAWMVPRNRRASRAVSEVRNQVQRHLKVTLEEKVWIDPEVNEYIWKNGIEKTVPQNFPEGESRAPLLTLGLNYGFCLRRSYNYVR